MLLEGRAPLEFFSLVAALPWLARLPRGDGHPVMVFPGMGASDITTVPLRRFLRSLGYVTHAWGQGLNFGPRPGVLERCADDLRALADKHGQPVSLIGWSLGGIYAREVAKLHPTLTRCVITLGTPFTGHPQGDQRLAHLRVAEPKQGRRRRPDGRDQAAAAGADDVDLLAQRRHRLLALQPERCRTAGREHRGAGEPCRHGHANPLVLYAVADRLAQPIGQWRPFDVSGARRWFFRTALPDAMATAS